MDGVDFGLDGGYYCGYGVDWIEGPPPNFRRLPLANYIGDRHLVLFGNSGAGKSRRLLTMNLRRLTGWSIICVDIKGALFKNSAAHRKARGSKIVNIDPYKVNGYSDGHNPIAAMKLDDDFPDEAAGHAEAIITPGQHQPHFGESAQDFEAACEMYVRLVLNGSYADVRRLMSLTGKRLQALIGAPSFEYPAASGVFYSGMIQAGIKYNWEEIGIKAGRFADINPANQEIKSVLSTGLTQTRWLDSRPIKADLAKPPFDFGSIKRIPTTVYLTLPSRRLATHAVWLRLMISSAMQQLLKDTAVVGNVPVLFMIDESYAIFQGGFPVVEKNYALVREYGIKIQTVWQDMAQMHKLYGNPGFETFLANAGVIQSFATNDLTTSNYLSQMTGQTTREIRSSSEARQLQPGQAPGVGISQTQNLGLIPMPLLMPQDIRNMDPGYTLIFSDKAKGVGYAYCPDPSEF